MSRHRYHDVSKRFKRLEASSQLPGPRRGVLLQLTSSSLTVLHSYYRENTYTPPARLSVAR